MPSLRRWADRRAMYKERFPMNNVDLVNAFTYEEQGGNPCPVVACADGMSSADMQDVARRFGRESGFVFSPKSGDCDFSFRFFVPNHEMEMCGHATIGALWVLMRQGRLPADTVRIETRSGPVTGFVTVGSDGQPAWRSRSPPAKLFRFAGMRRRRFCWCWVS